MQNDIIFIIISNNIWGRYSKKRFYNYPRVSQSSPAVPIFFFLKSFPSPSLPLSCFFFFFFFFFGGGGGGREFLERKFKKLRCVAQIESCGGQEVLVEGERGERENSAGGEIREKNRVKMYVFI